MCCSWTGDRNNAFDLGVDDVQVKELGILTHKSYCMRLLHAHCFAAFCVVAEGFDSTLCTTHHDGDNTNDDFCLQGRISMFCSGMCCEQYKTQKNILVTCEYCKQEKVLFDTISHNQQDLVFCSEGE